MSGEEVLGPCNCCLETVSSKSLWIEYPWMGNNEIYGKMLQECFNLIFSKKEYAERDRGAICEVCITHLRHAWSFKLQVVRCQEKLSKCQFTATYSAKRSLKIEEQNYLKSDPDISSDDEVLAPVVENRSKKTSRTKITDSKCAIKKEVTTKKGTKLKQFFELKRDPRTNCRLLLENSTICPFKSSRGYFNCFYCNKQYVVFEELRTHVNSLHSKLTLSSIMKSINRPYDKIKADITEIKCKICSEETNGIKHLIEHLTEIHQIKFNYESRYKPDACIIGYNLMDGKFECSECGKNFVFFKKLSEHMNEHSTDFVCDICGKCFAFQERLTSHIKTHEERAVVKCKVCGKSCPSKAALSGHIRYTHSERVYVCTICDLTFARARLRMKHLIEVHGRSPPNLTCSVCSMTFKTTFNLNDHTKRVHLLIPRETKFECNECGRRFVTKYVLKNHMLVHSGERNFECGVCLKKYARMKSLKEHMKIHRNEKRWLCAGCGQAFIQKSSLKNHIRVHHANTDVEQMIVFK